MAARKARTSSLHLAEMGMPASHKRHKRQSEPQAEWGHQVDQGSMAGMTIATCCVGLLPRKVYEGRKFWVKDYDEVIILCYVLLGTSVCCTLWPQRFYRTSHFVTLLLVLGMES